MSFKIWSSTQDASSNDKSGDVSKDAPAKVTPAVQPEKTPAEVTPAPKS